MARYMEREGLSLTHLVGPDTAHSYHPQTKRELEDRIDALARIGRDPLPRKIRFTTHTLSVLSRDPDTIRSRGRAATHSTLLRWPRRV